MTGARLAVLLLALAAAMPVAAAARPPTYVQATETEFRIALSRLAVPSGIVIVDIVNFGMDPHDLVLQRRAKGARQFKVPLVKPRGHAEIEARLVPGRYDLWCSLPGHRDRGMHAVLLVRR